MTDARARLPGSSVDSLRTPAAKVLIVDDLEDGRWVLSHLVRQAGFTPVVAAGGEEALACTRQEAPDLVLLDVCMPDMDGFEFLTRARVFDNAVPVIMLTAYGTTHDAVRAIRDGACDYLAKPFNHEEVLLAIRRALNERARRLQLREFSKHPQPAGSLADLMGHGSAVQRVLRAAQQVAPTNFSVLLTGETGTGKELVARAIHAQGPRAAKPLVIVDCGAIPDTLIESELFGHEKGSFTGAHQARAGAFELAGGGTIFLDEIGNLPPPMQSKLLRVLETRRVRRVGSMVERDVDFRVVAATNADLRATFEQQGFRSDLFHRLAEFTICLPPLRERMEDIQFLVHQFVAGGNKDLGKQVAGLTNAAWQFIERYEWPGNVRELRHEIRRAVLLCDDPQQLIGLELLDMSDSAAAPATLPACARPDPETARPCEGCPASCPFNTVASLLSSEQGLPLKEWIGGITAQAERAILVQALTLTQGNKARCARLLHIDNKTIHSKLKAYAISSPKFGGVAETPVGLSLNRRIAALNQKEPT